MLKGDTDGRGVCLGQDPSGFGADCAGLGDLTSAFRVVFVLYLNDLSFEVSSSSSSSSPPPISLLN